MRRIILIALLVASIPTMGSAESPSPFNDDRDGTISNIQMVPTSSNNGTTVVVPTAAIGATTPTAAQPAAAAPAPQPAPQPAPAAQAPAKKTHKVTAGDTLWGIAKKYLGDGSKYWEIIELNKKKYPSLAKNPDLIVDGWVLEVPDAAAQATQPGTSAPGANGATNGSNTNPGSTGNTGNATTPTPNPANNWTLAQKQQKLQDVVNQMNLQLLKEGKRMTQLNEATIREMINRKLLSEQDWMAMNPPAGQRWALDGAKVVLVTGNNVVVPATGGNTGSNGNATAPAGTQTAAEKAAAEKAAAEKDAAAKAAAAKAAAEKAAAEKTAAAKAAAEKAAAEKAAADKVAAEKAAAAKVAAEKAAAEKAAAEKAAAEKAAAAQTAAQKNFANDLKAIGMPDVFKNGDHKPYRDAITAGQKLLPGDWAHWSPFAKFSENYDPFSDLHVLQSRLMEAQKLYEKKVREGDVNSGIFRGDSIETAAKKVQEAKEMLSKKWGEFKPVYQQASQVANTAKADLAKINTEIGPARKRLEQLRANPNPSDAAEITSLLKKIEEFEKKSKECQEKCDAFSALTKVFGNP